MAALLALLPLLAWATDSAVTLRIPEATAEHEAWLVTYGPGEVYWQRFGHNAIWLREPAAGLDHTFNFGYFDFAQERFFSRFVQGRMLYFSLAQPSAAEFEGYRRENRGISAQKLDLRPDQYRRLRDHLLVSVQPDHREYLYDYYLDNCSTRVRDALDLALGGALAAQFQSRPAEQNFRAHTRRLTSMDFWYYLGLEAALGSGVDLPNDRWQEMFIPEVVAASLDEARNPAGEGTHPLVDDRQVLFAAPGPAPPPTPPPVWQRYLLLGAVLSGLAWLAGRRASVSLTRRLALAWIVLAGLAGLVLAGLWLLTDHRAAAANQNLLLLNPLFLAALAAAGRRFTALLLAIGTVAAAVLALIPGGQYTLDVLALAAPLNLAAATAMWGWRRGRA